MAAAKQRHWSRLAAPISAEPLRKQWCVCRADVLETQVHDTAAALAERGAKCKTLHCTVARRRGACELRVRPCDGFKLNMSTTNRAHLRMSKNCHPGPGFPGCRASR